MLSINCYCEGFVEGLLVCWLLAGWLLTVGWFVDFVELGIEPVFLELSVRLTLARDYAELS